MKYNFSRWLESRRELAKAFKGTLQGVPQDPIHHPEGDTFIHTKLVRRAIPRAIEELKSLKLNPKFATALQNIDFNCSPKELEILNLSAWLHDIGKATATTIDGEPWQTGKTGRIQAIGHQDPEHYKPQIEKLKDFAPQETVDLYLQNQDLVNFLIEHHMDFTSGAGFSKGFVAKYFKNGVVENLPEMKLLLILMWADKMGRLPEDTIAKAIEKNSTSLAASVDRSLKQSTARGGEAFKGTPEELVANLMAKGLSKTQRKQALKGKFPNLTDDEINVLMPENFRAFFEASEIQPHKIPADIPIDNNVKILSKALKQDDSTTQVYVVGGAVRDFLHHYYHGDPTTSYKPKDIDLTTNLSEEEILDRLRSPQAVNMGITVKEKESVDTFGVVFATVNHENYEIAPFRKDIGTSDGRRPDRVERGTIHDDAMRRDLTINNLYYDFDNKVILDFNPDGQGLEDIKNGVARPVGDPHERFNEDKLRVLRLVRFFSRFNPGSIKEKLDTKTASAIEQFKNLKSHGITVERIESEFTGGVKQAMNTASYIKNLYELGLLPQVFPNLKVDISGIDKIGNSKNIKVILAWLLRDNANVANVLNKLKYPAEIFDSVQFLINAMNFTPNEIFGIIRNRDKKLLKPNAVGIGGIPLSQEEINQHNLAKTASIRKDLIELSKLVDNPIIAQRLNHLVTYQAPVVSGDDLKKQGFKDEQIGKKQKELTTAHYQQSFNDFRK